MKQIVSILSIILIASVFILPERGICQEKKIIKLICDTAIISGKKYVACQDLETDLFILNEGRDTIYKHSEYGSFEFIDFNEDGYKDLMISYMGNTPGVQDLLLFNRSTNSFKIVKNFDEYPASQKINGTNYYFSYHRSGCADANWDSDLFYISNYRTFKIGNISGLGCEGEEKNGVFISKIKNDRRILIKEIIREPGYYIDKWDFIYEYWTNNYKLFIR